MDRVDLIKQLINDRFNRNQAAFARAIDKSPAQVSQWVTGNRSIGDGVARQIEMVLDLPAGWMWTGDLSEPSNVQPAHQVYSDVPLISWVQAGNWAEAIDLLHTGEGERIDTTYKPRRHTFALRVVNDSMSPEFAEGDIIIVEPDANAENGSYVVVRQNGNEATFKQLIKDGNHYYLKPLNKTYPMLEMNDDAVICGVVKEKIKRY